MLSFRVQGHLGSLLHERGKLADAENLLRRVLGNVAAVASEHVPNFTTSKDSYIKLHFDRWNA